MDKKTQYVDYGKIKEDLEQHYSTATFNEYSPHFKEDCWWAKGYNRCLDYVLAVMSTSIVADVVEVRYGRWERKEDECCYWFECSECGEEPAKTNNNDNYFSVYCPNCGAKMSI